MRVGLELIDSDVLQAGQSGLLTGSGGGKSWNNAQVYVSQFILKAEGLGKVLIHFPFLQPANFSPALGLTLMVLGTTIVPVRWVLLVLSFLW